MNHPRISYENLLKPCQHNALGCILFRQSFIEISEIGDPLL